MNRVSADARRHEDAGKGRRRTQEERSTETRSRLMEATLDAFNQSVYLSSDRRFYLGIIALHKRADRRLFSLETVEVEPRLKHLIHFLMAEISRRQKDPGA